MKKIFLIFFMLPLLFSCEREKATVPDGGQQSMRLLRFGLPTIGGTSVTRAPIDGSTFANGTWNFGMFIYNKHEGDDAHQPAAIGHNDIKAIARIPASSAEKSADWIFWFNPVGEGGSVREFTDLGVPNDQDGIVVAYYPYPENSDGIQPPHNVRFDTSTRTDYLYAMPKAYSQTSIDEEILLNFHHVMTCIEIQFKNMYTGDVTLKNLTLTDTGAAADAESVIGSTGYFDAYNGEIKSVEPVRSITYAQTTIGSTTSFYFIIPEIKAADVRAGRLEISFTLNNDGRVHTYRLPTQVGDQDLTQTGYRKGCRYQYKVTVDNTMKFQPGDFSDNDPSNWNHYEKEIDIPI